MASDRRPYDFTGLIRAGGELYQCPIRQVVDLDIPWILQVQIAGQAFYEDDVRDSRLHEFENYELVVPRGKGACLVRNHTYRYVRQFG
jgi:hypothetical protein